MIKIARNIYCNYLRSPIIVSDITIIDRNKLIDFFKEGECIETTYDSIHRDALKKLKGLYLPYFNTDKYKFFGKLEELKIYPDHGNT